MAPRMLVPLFVSTAVLAWAEGENLQRQLQDLERQQQREEQKIDQAEEQERVKLRSREREELARAQREAATAAATAGATVTATGSLAGLDPARLVQAKFAEDEVHNLIQNQLGVEVTQRFDRERRALQRKYTLQRAKLEAPPAGEGEDAAKQRDIALKTADINDKYQAQLDDLALAEAAEEAKVRFGLTTKVNTAERDLNILVAKHMIEQSAKGAAAAFNPAADPEYAKLAAARDDAKNALETALDELHAKFTPRRTDIENAREDELAKLNG